MEFSGASYVKARTGETFKSQYSLSEQMCMIQKLSLLRPKNVNYPSLSRDSKCSELELGWCLSIISLCDLLKLVALCKLTFYGEQFTNEDFKIQYSSLICLFAFGGFSQSQALVVLKQMILLSVYSLRLHHKASAIPLTVSHHVDMSLPHPITRRTVSTV